MSDADGRVFVQIAGEGASGVKPLLAEIEQTDSVSKERAEFEAADKRLKELERGARKPEQAREAPHREHHRDAPADRG